MTTGVTSADWRATAQSPEKKNECEIVCIYLKLKFKNIEKGNAVEMEWLRIVLHNRMLRGYSLWL